MAKTIKTTGVYANMVSCIGIEDDNTTIKDFVLPSRTITKHADASIQNGTYGYAVRTVNSGTYTVKGITVSNPRLSRGLSGTEQKTLIYVMNNFASVEDTSISHWETRMDASTGGSSVSAGYCPADDNPKLRHDTTDIYDSGANNLNGVRSMTAVQWEYGASRKAILYYAKNGEAFPGSPTYSDTTNRDGDRVGSYLNIIGGYQGALAFDLFLYMEFSTVLTQAELATIYDSLTGAGACDCFESASGNASRATTRSRFMRSN